MLALLSLCFIALSALPGVRLDCGGGNGICRTSSKQCSREFVTGATAVSIGCQKGEVCCRRSDWCVAFGADHTLCKYKGPNRYAGLDKNYCEDLMERGVSAEEQEEVLEEHNRLRKLVASGGQPPLPKAKNMRNLVWDEDLALLAQRWADQCKFGHDKSRKTDLFSWIGQNVHLGYGSHSDFHRSWASVTQSWFKENKRFIEEGGNVDSFGGMKGVGHFTQEIWATTTHIGCGRSKFHRDGRYNIISVCNYGPGGNRKGEPVYQRA